MNKIIDIHSHMFNLKYLPLAGILVRYSKGKIPTRIAKGIEWLMLKGIDKALQKEQINLIENFDLTEYEIPLSEFLDKKFEYKNDSIINFTEEELIEAFFTFTNVNDLLFGKLGDAISEFENSHQEFINSGTISLSEFKKTPSDKKIVFIRYRIKVFKKMLKWILKQYSVIKNHIKWFIFMRNNEEDIYTSIKEDEINVSLFVHHMMDVDHFFNKSSDNLIFKSRYNFERQQLPYMQSLNSNHEKLIGFVAFNPARDNYQEIIKDAINNKGFKGVKFYPPMGYRAFEDKKYSNQINWLLSYCQAKGIPIMTHCNNAGFESYPEKSGINSNPKFWGEALKIYPNLFLCLGHAGGSEGWFSKIQTTDRLIENEISSSDICDDSNIQEQNWNKSYAAFVFKLCVKYDNVYCDFSYIDDMINSKGQFDNEKEKILRQRLLNLLQSEKSFKKKIMYGSDWHMLFREGKNKVYLKSYINFFSNGLLKKYSEDFFYNNALKYLSLSNIN